MYFNANFNVFFKLIKVHLLVSELFTSGYLIPLTACVTISNYLLLDRRCLLRICKHNDTHIPLQLVDDTLFNPTNSTGNHKYLYKYMYIYI